ncbi:hypothetical protein [Egbenema bharatensis]
MPIPQETTRGQVRCLRYGYFTPNSRLPTPPRQARACATEMRF